MTPSRATTAAERRPRTTTTTKTAGTCRCAPDLESLRSRLLCVTKHPPLCSCEDGGARICPTRFEHCPDGKCRAGVVETITTNDTMYGCDVPDFLTDHVSARPQEPCRDFATSDLSADVASAASAPERVGADQCNFCLGRDNMVFAGKTGDVCKGVLPSNGETHAGHLRCSP